MLPKQLGVSDLLKGILPPWCFSWFYKNGIAVFILLAPAAGKSLSCGQLIRITGISPLRGSLRAVSGSTIIILAVIANIGSCPMVCDGFLAQPPLFQKGQRVPHRWLITRTDVSVLAYSVFKVRTGSLKRSLYYICRGKAQKLPPSRRKFFAVIIRRQLACFLAFL